MKNIIITAFMLFLTVVSFAQMEGEVIYVTTVNIHKQLDERGGGRRAEDLKKMLPKTQKIKQVLYFNETEALFKKLKEEANVEADVEDDRSLRFLKRMMGGGDKDESYTNHDEGTVVNKRDFLGKTFLITGEQEEKKWKLTGETKKINGYQCMKAELQIDPPKKRKEEKGKKKGDKKEGAKEGAKEKKDGGDRRSREPRSPRSIVAWFTTQIPVPVGPKGFDQLPGLVIQVEIGGQDNIITAETINLKTLDKGTIKKPKGGKKVTDEEYKKIMREKMEEMRKERGGRGGRGH